MKREASPVGESRKKAKNKDELMKQGLEHWRANRDADAKKLFEEVLEIDDQFADAHYYLCRLAWDARHYATSRRHVDKCLEINPNHARANVSLGYIYNFNNEVVLAQKHFEKALTLDPRLGDGHYYLAELFRGQGKLVKAKEHYKKAINSPFKNTTRTVQATYWLCRIAWQEKDYTLSRFYVNQCLELDPDHVRANVSLGYIHMFNKEYELAKSRYKRALALNPKHADALNYLGNVLLRQGDNNSAKSLFQRCLEISPNRKNVLQNLIIALFRLNEGEGAFTYCQRLLRLDPTDVNSHVYLGRIYIKREDYASALSQYEKYFKLYPNDNPRFLQVVTSYGRFFPADGLLRLFEEKLVGRFDITIYNRFNDFIRTRMPDRWKEINPLLNSTRHPFATVDAFTNWNILTKAHQAHFNANHPEILRNLQIVSSMHKFCLHEILKDSFSEETVNIIHSLLYSL